MHIAVITSQFPVLSQTFVLNQITALIDAGHDVTVIANRPRDKTPVHADVERYGLLERTIYWDQCLSLQTRANWRRLLQGGLRGGRSLLLGQGESLRTRFRRAAHLSKAPAFDAIICHFGNLARECQILRDLGVLRGPLATVFHGYDMSQELQLRGPNFYDQLLQKGDLFLPISGLWRERLIELGAAPERTKVHHMGIDLERFEFQPRKPAEDGTIRLLSIGRFVEKKGFAAGLRAFAKVAPDYPNLRYTILGDGELREELEGLTQNLKIADRVELPGYKSRHEVQAQLQEHEILFTPSQTAANGDMEGIPMVLMEGMASGMPVLSTRHSGIPELVEHGKSGFLAGEGDVEELARYLRDLLEKPEAWEAMGQAGRAAVEAGFSLRDLNNRLITHLEELAAA